MGILKAWSASRIFNYEVCPRQLYYRAVRRLPEPAGPPLVRGKKIHAEGEAYLKAKKAIKVPKSFSYVEKELRALRRSKAISEEQWGFDADWKRIDWFDATIRMVLDARAMRGSVVKVVDFKTGRPRPDKDESQVALYAVGAFALFPKTRTVAGQVWYLDIGEIVEVRFGKQDAEKEREAWEARAQKLLDDDKLDPTPGYACKWCAFGVSKGGPCKAEKL